MLSSKSLEIEPFSPHLAFIVGDGSDTVGQAATARVARATRKAKAKTPEGRNRTATGGWEMLGVAHFPKKNCKLALAHV